MTDLWNIFLSHAPDLWTRFLEHMNMTTMAVVLSIAIGVPLAIAVTHNKKTAAIVIGLANLMQSIPCIALLAFSVPFVGIGEKPAILMVITYALLPIIKNTYTGLTSINPAVLEAADGIGYSQWQKLWKVEMPLAMPFIMAGIRISAVAAVGNMTIAAFAGAGGLGWFINMGLIGLNLPMVLLGAIPASILALLIDYMLSEAEQLLVPEGLKHAAEIENGSGRRLFTKITVSFLCLALVLFPVGVRGWQYYRTETQKTVIIGTSNFTEAFILGYMYEDLIEARTDIKVERRFNLNGADFAWSALINGHIDTFVEATGTALTNFAKLPVGTDHDQVYKEVHDTLLAKYQVVVSAPLGYEDTYVFSMRPETAEKYNIHTLSDLIRESPNLTLGCTTEFVQRDDGLPGLEKNHGMHFKDVRPMDATIRYQAVTNGDVDVIDAFSTEGLLKKMALQEIPDDIHYFPPFDAVSFNRADLFEKYPELKDVWARLDGKISTRDMRDMNYAVDVEGKDPHEVAHQFLIERGFL